MKRLIGAILFLMLATPATAANYMNGASGGAAAPITVTANTVFVLLPVRAERYEYDFACNVPVEIAWGAGTAAPSPAPTVADGYPLTANATYKQEYIQAFMQSPTIQSDVGVEIDGISTSSGSCWTHEMAVH